MTADPGTELELADWRRTIAALYADVRALAEESPEIAWRHWIETRERLYQTHPQSPVRPADRPTFRARHWPYDPALRFEAALVADPGSGPDRAADAAARSTPLALPNSGPDDLAFRRLGLIELRIDRTPARLSLFWLAGYAGGLFLPFRDATSGRETYGAGRYILDAAKGADLGGDPAERRLIVDFNFAYQPSCAFDPRWACPLAPPENRLAVPIRAGERIA